MKIKTLPQPLQDALPVLQTLNQAGFQAYYVGGCVRDTILQRPIHDVDLATSAYPAEIKSLFAQTIDTGIQHGTVTVVLNHENYEVTTFRTESGYQDYRRPDHVEFVRSLDMDLQRRDFTINALALDATGEVHDLFGGLEDLRRGQIRAVGQAEARFHEDALRMMRAVRFQAQFGFPIAEQTLAGITQNAALLTKIAVERIHVEFIKLMLAPYRKLGLDSFQATGLASYCPQFKGHDCRCLAGQSSQPLTSEAVVWTLIGYLWQLPPTQLRSLLRAWKTTNETQKRVTRAVTLLQLNTWRDWDLYQAGTKSSQLAQEVLLVTGKSNWAQELQERQEHLPIYCSQDLALGGQAIMEILHLAPGPEVGRLLEELQQAVVARKIPNQVIALTQFLQQKRN
ncbi:CCA tRNA nucleotidyltransferase [Lactobacillus sp. DCY120]|uniref:CCA-adding enzyme n=1 Tax=Bombilactobacillus apium TaxID=2675299 RepID=A0A850R164_9LACO|nr:CCA tRNA nucleotidyltransferase [Bombilactobacillus apium]NVY95761.1 CCA tRNA nucleotidyltransferase [Bombilactobacillus apium]